VSLKDVASLVIHRIELPTPFAVGCVNAYLIVSGQQKVLVDCGPRYAKAREALLDGLKNCGVAPNELTGLVLTHGHVDHVGLASEFQSMGVSVYSHPDVSTWLEPGGKWDVYRYDFYSRLYQEMGMSEEDRARALKEFLTYRSWNDRSVVDLPLSDGDALPPLPMFRVIHVPGHAQAAIALWNEQTGELLSGDQLIYHISSNALIEPRLDAPSGHLAERTMSLVDYRNNLTQLAQLPIQKVYPGHGDVFDGAHALIQKRLEDQIRRRDKFLSLLSHLEPCSAFDLALSFFPAAYRSQASLILSETLGFLDWAAADGFVTSERHSDGIVRWTIL
jgi:glyoxylase-like metal-dependent hydrolase (beta-lactamase superfamily II)